jgi:hypothetical protein
MANKSQALIYVSMTSVVFSLYPLSPITWTPWIPHYTVVFCCFLVSLLTFFVALSF